MDTGRDQKNLLGAIFCLVLSVPLGYLVAAGVAGTRAMIVAFLFLLAWTAFAVLGLFACLMGWVVAKSRHNPPGDP